MTPEKHIMVWDSCLKIISQIVEPQPFKTWFAPIIPVSIVESTLTVEVPSEFFREYLEEYYLDVLKKVLKRELGATARLVYKVKPVQVQPYMTYPASNGHAPTNKAISIPVNNNQVQKPNPLIYPGIPQQKVQVNPHLNPVYCFNNLIVGECNKMGITAGESISKAPGKTAFNPLFLFGGPGLGKTHIAQAIGLSIKEQYQDLVVLYVPANRFKIQYMDAVTVKNKLTDFLAFYMKIDVLIIDDIQELSTPGTQNAFFHIFNHLHQSGKQLIFTSDRAPVDLKNFEERLLTRLKWGLSVELEKPLFSTRLAMLKSRCFREGVNISEDVLAYLAKSVETNFRELEGALISLVANATLAQKEVTVKLVDKIVGKLIGEKKVEITIDKVKKVVCEYFKLSATDLLSKSRKRQIVQARQIAMYLTRNHISCSLSTIGSEIGGKDHATVLHACNTVADLVSTDRTFKQYIQDIDKLLLTSHN